VDFEVPPTRNITETVSTIAHLSRFIVADITDPRSVPQELQSVIPQLPSVPVVPLLQAGTEEYGMFLDFMSFPQVLEVHRYNSEVDLSAEFQVGIIDPAEAKATELEGRRPLTIQTLGEVLDSILPPANKEVEREAYPELLSELRRLGILSRQELKALVGKHLKAVLKTDAAMVRKHRKRGPEALRSFGNRLATGVFLSHVDLVREALRRDLGSQRERGS